MGLGSSSSKNYKGQHVSLIPKASKASKNAKVPEYMLYPLNGMLIDSKNGINYISLDENESKMEVVAVAASEYDTKPYDDGTGTMAAAAAATDATAIMAESELGKNTESEMPNETEMELEPVSDKTTITEEEPKQKGGKRRKSAKSHHKNKQRKSRRKHQGRRS